MKTLGVFFLSTLLSAALFLGSAQAFEADGLNIKFKGDGYVRGFSNKNKETEVKTSGYAQRLRLGMDVTTKDKIKLSSSVILSGDTWSGDPAKNAPTGNSDNQYSTNGGNPLRLDYGFIEVPFENGWIGRAGRQTANFSDCFNTCDDRRDRLMLMKFYGNLVPVVLFDRRREGDLTTNRDDADMYAAALFHVHQVHEWALLYAFFQNGTTGYELESVHNFSPYYKYKGKKFKALAVWNWLGAGEANSWYHEKNAHSFALKGEYLLSDNFDFGAQIVKSYNGGLIASGYDTWSFVVNNSPEYNRSNSLQVSIGGLGSLTGGNKDDEALYIGRVRYKNDKLTAALAVGKGEEYMWSSTAEKEEFMLYDFQVQYAYSKSLTFKAGYALLRDEKKVDASLFQMETKF